MKKEIRVQEEVDFQVQKFRLNRYDLDDGTLLRFAAFPIKVLRTAEYDPRGVPIYHVLSQNIMSATIPQDLRGPPGEPLPPDQLAKTDSTEVEFVPREEPWNIFELSDGSILRMRTVISSVVRYTHRNQFGEPIYMVNSTNSVAVKAPSFLQGDQ